MKLQKGDFVGIRCVGDLLRVMLDLKVVDVYTWLAAHNKKLDFYGHS